MDHKRSGREGPARRNSHTHAFVKGQNLLQLLPPHCIQDFTETISEAENRYFYPQFIPQFIPVIP
jgi:hypothetical protein